MIKKNIVILTASHPYKAAGIVALDLMSILKQSNYNVIVVTNSRLEKKYEDTLTLKGISNFNLIYRVLKSIKIRTGKLFKNEKIKKNPDYHMNGLAPSKRTRLSEKVLNILPPKIDAFIYLFPQNFLDTDELNHLNRKTEAPIFWYMMDMAPMTGGCHYAWNCLGYTVKCGSCPGIYSNDENDPTNRLWEEKKKHIESSNIIPVAASQWQYEQLKKSSLFTNKSKYKILLPVDSNRFKPKNKIEARIEIGLPKDKKILLFGAASINDSRKGLVELIQALKILKSEMKTEESENIFLAIAGNHDKQLEDIIPFNHKFLGYLDYNLLATAYQAADLFACPSIEDSGPMMINQAILCGTPVVSFHMGVSLDLVINNKTGYRVENGNTSQFAKAIKQILALSTEELEDMSIECRQLGLEKTSMSSIRNQWMHILEYELSKFQ